MPSGGDPNYISTGFFRKPFDIHGYFESSITIWFRTFFPKASDEWDSKTTLGLCSVTLKDYLGMTFLQPYRLCGEIMKGSLEGYCSTM